MPLLQKQNYNWFQNCFCTQIREDWGQNMSFLYVWIFQPVTVFKVFSLTVKVSFLFKGNPDRSTKKKMNISLLTNAFPHNASAWPSHLKNTEANVILMLTIKKLSGFFFFWGVWIDIFLFFTNWSLAWMRNAGKHRGVKPQHTWEDWAVSIQPGLREGPRGAAQDEVRKVSGVHIGRVSTYIFFPAVGCYLRYLSR